MKTVFKIGIVIIILTITSCKKDDFNPESHNTNTVSGLAWQNPNCDEIFEIPETADDQMRDFGNQHKFPVFNPKNRQEFAYYEIKVDTLSGDYTKKLMKFNYLTKKKITLLSDVEIAVPIV